MMRFGIAPSVADSGRWSTNLSESGMAFTDQKGERAPTIADLYQSHSAWLRWAVRKQSGGANVDDVVQETFERVIGRSEQTALRYPKAFLLRVAQNILRDLSRKEVVYQRTVSENIFLESPALGSTDQFETVLLKQVVLALPAAQREVFLLSRFGGLTYEEIAKACGISVKTVEWRMAKAIAQCASKLRE